MKTDDDSTRLSSDDCVVPTPVEPEALERYLLKKSPFDGAAEIRAYVEGQEPDETVTYLERIATERVVGREHETWDVHTNSERYWVITNPTNLYAQRLFPSADYTLTFHVGLVARIASRRTSTLEEEEKTRLIVAWRKWTQAAQAFDVAHEAEEYQAVGMRCRECLLALVQAVASESMVPPGSPPPKAADFIHWSEIIASSLARGRSAKELRGYLGAVGKSSWQLVSWLTHAVNATSHDAEMALEATHSTLTAYGLVVLRFESGAPARCEKCQSYRMVSRHLPEIGPGGSFVVVCEACGWFEHDDYENSEGK